ncbi:MAG: rRNA adenine dimethyltransferase family protein [Candidatus Doudnabacteria bacterium]
MTNEIELKNYFRAHGLKPKDYLGQNFLIDEDVLREMIGIAELKPTDVVLEVGPGLGVLTKELAARCREVLAVEKDSKLFKLLKEELIASASGRLVEDKSQRPRGSLILGQIASSPPEITLREKSGSSQIRLFNDDILKFHVAENIKGEYKVVANIPYYLTSKLIQNFLENVHQPKLLVIMIQKEVGERIVAGPGKLSMLGISVQIYADAEIAAQVPRQSFWPVPEVDSVILKILPRNKYSQITDHRLFFRILKMAFAGKRKQIANSLSNGLNKPKEDITKMLRLASIDPTTRPQDVKIEQWIELYKVAQMVVDVK